VSVNDQKPIRAWRVRAWRIIAEELSREFDARKIVQLTIELDKALQEQEGWSSSSEAGRALQQPPTDDQAERDE